MRRQLPPRSLLKCDLQDEAWKKPVASGALQVGYLPPRYPEKKEKEREDEEENGRGAPRVTPVEA